VVKICLDCYDSNAGGFRCDRCGGRLVHTSDPEARQLPESVWKSQRVDYGARRGMVWRFMAIIAGVGVGLYGLRMSVAYERPWSIVTAVLAVVAGLVVWRWLYNAADRGVRIWVFHKGKVHKKRLAKAMLQSMVPRRGRTPRGADPAPVDEAA
jgi:hypothetical protein